MRRRLRPGDCGINADENDRMWCLIRDDGFVNHRAIQCSPATIESFVGLVFGKIRFVTLHQRRYIVGHQVDFAPDFFRFARR